MKVDVVMPVMGESIAEGTISRWLKKPGERVDRDDAILEITTDKIDTEIPAPESGVLEELLVEEGSTVEVGTVLARIETSAEGEPEATLEVPAASQEPIEEARGKEKVFSPVARKMARKGGLTDQDLERIEGSGLRGRVVKEDVARYLEEHPEPEVAGEAGEKRREGGVRVVEMSQMRKLIAEHMVRSKRVAPHTYTVAEVDMSHIVRFREAVKARFERENGFKLTFTPFVLHATALALKKHPMMNSSVEGDRILLRDYVNLGVAVALESGLIVPVIMNADEKNLLGIARSANDLANKAQSKRLKPDDVQGGTFTVTNPGVFGNIFGLPIINQPQVGILGVGAIKKRPVVVDDAIAIRSIMLVSLSYDHRVIDGALAARFLQELRGNLEGYDVSRAL